MTRCNPKRIESSSPRNATQRREVQNQPPRFSFLPSSCSAAACWFLRLGCRHCNIFELNPWNQKKKEEAKLNNANDAHSNHARFEKARNHPNKNSKIYEQLHLTRVSFLSFSFQKAQKACNYPHLISTYVRWSWSSVYIARCVVAVTLSVSSSTVRQEERSEPRKI